MCANICVCMYLYLFISDILYFLLSPILKVNVKIAVTLWNVNDRNAKRIDVATLNSSHCTYVLHTNLYVY